MSQSQMPGHSRQIILDILRSDGPTAVVDMVERVGISHGNVGRHLSSMESEGLVARRFENSKWRWSIAESAEVRAEPSAYLDPAPAPAETPRVKLIEELLEIERLMIEMSARRAEILEALK